MKKIYMLALAFLCAVTIIHSPVSVSGKSLSDLEKEKKNISGEIKETQSQLNSAQSEMARISVEIETMDNNLSALIDELDTIEQTLANTEALLNQMEKDLSQAQTDRDDQFEAFKTRLRVMYELGSVSYIDVLFQATSFRDFITRLGYMNDLAKHDQQMVDRMQQAEDRVSGKVEDIARQRNTIEALQYMQTVKKEELEVSLADKNAYMTKLDEDVETYQATLNKQKEDEKEIQEAYKKALAAKAAQEAAARKANLGSYNGTMLWPLPSFKKVTDTYRQRTNPVNKKPEFHSGLDISASTGSDILAADSGTVILAKYNGGYGNCVIIDHGGGVSTLYGHASKLVVSVGQSVKKGDVIAKVGSTGLSTGPHLHFEVRINGNHTNPKGYVNY